MWSDIRYGARRLRKSPGFAGTAVFTLGVGIGVTVAIYSVVDAMLWKPVPLPRLESLVMVLQRVPDNALDWDPLSPADLADIRRATTALEDIASWQGGLASVEGADGRSEGVLRALVSANFFDALGVEARMGRSFVVGEDEPGSEPRVILSHRLWKSRFGSDSEVVGRTLRLDGRNATVVGVMPDSFDFPLGTEIWTPNALSVEERHSRKPNRMTALARLKPDRTLAQASVELDEIGERLRDAYPDTNRNREFMIRPAHRFLVNYQREQYLLMLLGSAAFVLLIACGNVANLQFVRATGRSREVALRTALGASRWRVVSQFVTESLLLSLAGGALGLGLGKLGMSMIKAGMPAELVTLVLGWQDIELDHRALGFALAATFSSGILAGLAPAWQSSRPSLTGALKEGGRGGSAGGSRHVLRHVLVGGEIVLALVVLVGAGLMVRGFRAQVESGARLEPATLLTLRLSLTGNVYNQPHQILGFYREALRRLGALPGVRSVAAVTALPYSGHSIDSTFSIEGRAMEPDDLPRGMYQAASPAYFETVRLPLRDGRLLRESDGPEAPRVVLISERLARRWWPGESPLGQRIRWGTDAHTPWLTIVGVVEDMIHSPYDREPRRALYVPYQQAPAPWMDIGVRTSGPPLLLAPEVTAAIRDLDREQPITEVRTMEQSIHNSAIGLNYMAVLMGAFGLFALALSAIGVYSVLAQLVSEQTRDLGLRMALGAPRLNVLGIVFRRGMLTVAAGLMVGLPLAWALSRFLASVIYGVTAGDAATFLGIPLALVASAAIAIYIPARRAMRIDPIVALRYE